MSVLLIGGQSVGVKTWGACALAFLAGLVVVLVDGAGDAISSGAGGGGVPKVTSLLAQGSLVMSALLYSVFRVRAEVHLRTHSAERLNLFRMVWLGLISSAALAIEVAMGGPGRSTMRRMHLIKLSQWGKRREKQTHTAKKKLLLS